MRYRTMSKNSPDIWENRMATLTLFALPPQTRISARGYHREDPSTVHTVVVAVCVCIGMKENSVAIQ